MKFGRGRLVAAMSAVVVSAGLAIGSASANEIFQQQTGKSCADCHRPNQEKLGVQGLNPMGLAFKNCGYKFGCSAAAPPSPSAPPAATPPAASVQTQNTTETHQGVATFSNTRCGAQTRTVVVRAGGNTRERSLILFVEPNQKIKVGVSRGTTWAASCEAIKEDAQFRFVAIDLILD